MSCYGKIDSPAKVLPVVDTFGKHICTHSLSLFSCAIKRETYSLKIINHNMYTNLPQHGVNILVNRGKKSIAGHYLQVSEHTGRQPAAYWGYVVIDLVG